MTKPTRKQAKRRADDASRMWAHRTYSACVTCGSPHNLQWAHLMTCTHESTRWDVRNVYIQCAACNIRHEQNSWPLISFAIERFGKQEIDALSVRHFRPEHYKTEDLLSVAESLSFWEQRS